MQPHTTESRRQDHALLSWSRVQLFGAGLGLCGFLITFLLPAPLGWPLAAWQVAGLAWLMGCLWISEALPLAATALLPIVLGPLLGLGELRAITNAYAHPLIFLFMGGFVLSLAMERWRLHERVALRLLLLVGSSPKRELAGFMLASGLLSMWVSNTATVIMMLPTVLSVIRMRQGKAAAGLGVALLLGVAYAANVGGVATLIGTAPNALLAAYLSEQHGVNIGFAQWLLIGLPVSVVLWLFIWWWLGRHLGKDEHGADSRALFEQRLQALGPMSTMEKRVAVVFLLTACAWITRPLLVDGLGWNISDAGIAMTCAVLLHLLPAGDGQGERLMCWKVTENLPWGVLLLFGGGLALASMIQSTGLAQGLADLLTPLGAWPSWVLIVAVALLVVFLTEVTSNTATTAGFLPLLGATAVAMGLPAEVLAIPAAIAASCAFMMPVATPPNAIVFASGELHIREMVTAGLVINLVATAVISCMAVFFLLP
jgi:sodium-dependent dicarboxylate transporter 2/3/5